MSIGLLAAIINVYPKKNHHKTFTGLDNLLSTFTQFTFVSLKTHFIVERLEYKAEEKMKPDEITYIYL